jgi:predicted lipid-binding transport protein (Tim44 family)
MIIIIIMIIHIIIIHIIIMIVIMIIISTKSLLSMAAFDPEQQQQQQQQQQQCSWCTREMRSRRQPDAFAGFHNTPKRKLADLSQPRQQHLNPTTAKPNKKHQDGKQIKF